MKKLEIKLNFKTRYGVFKEYLEEFEKYSTLKLEGYIQAIDERWHSKFLNHLFRTRNNLRHMIAKDVYDKRKGIKSHVDRGERWYSRIKEQRGGN